MVMQPSEIVTLAVSIVSVAIAGIALWRNWRWQPREARFELVALDGSLASADTGYFHVVNVGDVVARSVRYELDQATLTGDATLPREVEIAPGRSGKQIRIRPISPDWRGAHLIVTWNPFPVHRGRRRQQRVSLIKAIQESDPPIDVLKTIW